MKLSRLPKNDRKYFYRSNTIVKRLQFIDSKGQWLFEDKKVTWTQNTGQTYEGWCACSFQLVCPFRKLSNGTCDKQCHSADMRKAIEAFVAAYTENNTISYKSQP